MILLSGVVVLGVLSTMRVQSAAWPRFLTTGLHRNLALVTLVFLALHIVTAVVDPFTHLGWLTAIVPFESYYRTPCRPGSWCCLSPASRLSRSRSYSGCSSRRAIHSRRRGVSSARASRESRTHEPSAPARRPEPRVGI